MTAKTLKFVYEWVGPAGPLSNTRMPNIADLSWSQFRNEQPITDYVDNPFVFESFLGSHVITPHYLSTHSEYFRQNREDKFFYELNFSAIFYRSWHQFFDVNYGALSNNYHTPYIMDEIRFGNGYLLITILFESWVDDTIFDKITKFLRHHDIPLNKCVYFTNCANSKDIYNAYCRKRNITPEINVEYFPTFRTHKTDIELVLEKYKNIPYNRNKREKIFLCFQRRFNDHRIAMLLNASKNAILNKFFISMDSKNPETEETFALTASTFIDRYPDFNFTKSDINLASLSLPLTLDTDNFDSYPMESSQFSTESFYKSSLINIISETYFFSKEIHLTEKTWKPIAFKQPFIMVGSKGSLQHLKDLGFKTFNDFWDESYDQCDDEERMIKLFSIINSIATWNTKQQQKFMSRVQDIVEYNFNHLCTMHDTELDYIKDKYGN